MTAVTRPYTITVYQAADGFRLRIKAPNGRIVADGGESYSTRQAAERAAVRLASAKLVVVRGAAS